jgi:HK97 family phage prohead protease
LGGKIKKMITKNLPAQVNSVDLMAKTVSVMVSAGQRDRDGEIIDPSSFVNNLQIYKQHPLLIASHDSRDLLNHIGEATDIQSTPDGLKATFMYYAGQGNKLADWAWYLASERKIAAFSVGFMPLKWEEGDGKDYSRKYTEVELYEVSQVLIPSFRGAIQDDRKLSSDLGFIRAAKAYFGESEVDNILEEKTGRSVSKKNIDKVKNILTSLDTTKADLLALIEEWENPLSEDLPPKEEPKDIKENKEPVSALSRLKKYLSKEGK